MSQSDSSNRTQDQNSASLSSYPCGTCDVSVTNDDRGVACETCGQWFHANCQSIGGSYDQLGASDVIWRCLICDGANYSDTAFDLHDVGNTTLFSDASLPSPKGTSFQPFHTSTPTRVTRQNKQQNRPIRFLNVNARSNVKNLPGMLNLIETTKPDVIIGTETWLDGSIASSEILPSHYKVFRRDRRRDGGGVLIAVADHLICHEVPELAVPDCELIWVKIKLKRRKHLLVASYYKPDVSDEESQKRFASALQRATPLGAYIVIGGDFNLPSLDWNTCSLKTPSVHPRLHNDFLDLLNDHGLQQMVTFPTRENNTLDLFVTNFPSLVPRIEGVPGVSDHFAVYMEFQIYPARRNNTKRLVPQYNKADWPALRSAAKDLSSSITTLFNSTSDTEEIWSTFKDGLHSIVSTHIPHTTLRAKNNKPWVDFASRRMIKKRDRVYKKWKKSGDPGHLKELKDLKRQVQRQLRRNYWSHTSHVIEENNDGSRKTTKNLWTYVKAKRTEGVSVSPLKVDGRLVTDSQGQAEILNRQFQSAFSEPFPCTPEDFESRTGLSLDPEGPTCSNITITEEGVRKLLRNLNPRKASGPDGISPKILKALADELTPALTLLYQSSLTSGTVPCDWRTANVTPIFKKGERYRAENYRPISLTSIPGKLLEHIIVHNIMSFAERNKIICKQQHGFRKKRSCVSQLLGLIDELTHDREKGKQVDMLVMDFAKAFDKVSHTLLIHKLQHYGITGQINNWVQSFLTDRRQAVVVDGATSEFVPVKSGVPQGSVLGPCLFLLFINDLPKGLTSTARLFADDTACHKAICKAADQTDLQNDLNQLALWEEKWLMSFHPDKCEAMHFGKKLTAAYHLRDHTLHTTSEAKYLGVMVSTDLNWGKHVSCVAKKANKTLGFLRRNLKISSISIKDRAFKALVRPQLEYACQVWDPHYNTDKMTLEKILRRAARWVVNRHRQTSSVDGMFDQLNWTPLEERRRKARLTTFYKYHHGEVVIDTARAPPKLKPAYDTRHSHDQQYAEKTWHRNYRKSSFFPRTVNEWNKLPHEAITSASVEGFSSMI